MTETDEKRDAFANDAQIETILKTGVSRRAATGTVAMRAQQPYAPQRRATDVSGKRRQVEKKKKTGRGATKAVQDPTRPKGPKGPYLCFVGERRPQIKAENPKLSFPDIARQLGIEWKSMSAADRLKYENLSDKDKQRYLQEFSTWKPLEETEMEKLREEQRKRKAAGGLQIMYKCSPELREFLGDNSEQINRATLTTRVWEYFKTNDSLDATNRKYAVPDAKLAKFLGIPVGEKFLAFTVARYFSRHLLPL